MRLEGRIYAGERLMRSAVEEVQIREHISLSKSLDVALVNLCHRLNLPNLTWLSKNTREFSHYRQTIFFPEQFAEPIDFSQFQIKLFESDGA